ncbi:MAG: WD40 repeat domain-containing serine/threonine protein kinase [Verrucomicrobiia bacterium]
MFPQRFAGYDLLERIGEGGMGVVYRARQISLDRIVAVKVLPHGALASKEQVLRFRTEAATAGSLQHPNIVAIHEVGLCEDRHFLVMDFVQGQTLAELVRAGPLSPLRAAGYLQTIAEVVHHAHEHGILHRDLKPSNVLIDAEDQPRITDFGLAKRLESGTDLTLSGQVLGSPHYMSPEQAAGRHREVGRRSDVYALGAILYHLLTGRPPFVGETLSAILPQVTSEEPLRPRQLNPAVPADLETLCLKCLEKELPRRYPTALALAEELGRFQRGEPIVARPVGAAGSVWRWCRRNPRVALAVSVAAFGLLLGLAGVGVGWHRSEGQRARAEANEYVLSINVAQHALNANDSGHALELLNRYGPVPKAGIDLRGFEWRYLWQQCQSDAEAVIGQVGLGVRSLDVSADGRWLFAGCQRAPPKVWNLATGEALPLRAEWADWAWGNFSPDGRLLLVSPQTVETYGTICVWDLQTRTELEPIVDGRPVGPMAFSADGNRFGYTVLLTNGAPSLVILEFPSRKRICELSGHSRMPDERKGWEWLLTNDGGRFIGSDRRFGGGICLWDLTPGSEPQEFPGHRETITAMALSPDGRLLATAAGYTETGIKLWEVPSIRPLGELSGHQAWITALEFSPDGQTLASAAADQTMRLWDVPTRDSRRVFTGLPANIWRLCFSGDGQKLFTGSADGVIHRWAIEAQRTERGSFRRRSAVLDGVVVSPDARRFAGLRDGTVYLGDTVGTDSTTELHELGTNNTCLLFSGHGKSLLAGTQSGEIRVWSLDRRVLERCLRGSAGSVTTFRQDRHARTLVAFHWRGRTEADGTLRPRMDSSVEVEVWRTDQWRVRGTCTIAGPWAIYAVSPDGQWLAADSAPGTIQARSLSRLSQTYTLRFPGQIRGLAFSPDARFFAGATAEGSVRVWEVPTFRETQGFRARPHGLSALAFSPDSRRLVAAGGGQEAIKLWDVGTWQELITLPCEGGNLGTVSFTADGDQLVAGNVLGELFFWRAPSWAELEKREKPMAIAK